MPRSRLRCGDSKDSDARILPATACTRMCVGTRVAGYVVNVNWNADNRKWNVNAWKLDDDNWNAGCRAFSRNSFISPVASAREFLTPDLSSIRQAFCLSRTDVL